MKFKQTFEKYITNINEDVFTTIIKNGQIVEYRYEQQYPYLLYIEKDLIEHELVIEFTGKILQELKQNLNYIVKNKLLMLKMKF